MRQYDTRGPRLAHSIIWQASATGQTADCFFAEYCGKLNIGRGGAEDIPLGQLYEVGGLGIPNLLFRGGTGDSIVVEIQHILLAVMNPH